MYCSGRTLEPEGKWKREKYLNETLTLSGFIGHERNPSWDADESLTLYPTPQTLKHKENEREALKEKKKKKKNRIMLRYKRVWGSWVAQW